MCEGNEGNGRDVRITGYLVSSVGAGVHGRDHRGEGGNMAGGLKGIDPLSGRKLSVPVRRCLVIAQRDRLKISAAARLHAAKFPTHPVLHGGIQERHRARAARRPPSGQAIGPSWRHSRAAHTKAHDN